MCKYTAKQIAESDDLFEKQINKVRKFNLTRNPTRWRCLKKEKSLSANGTKVLSRNMIKNITALPADRKTEQSIPKAGIASTVILTTGFQRITKRKEL